MQRVAQLIAVTSTMATCASIVLPQRGRCMRVIRYILAKTFSFLSLPCRQAGVRNLSKPGLSRIARLAFVQLILLLSTSITFSQTNSNIKIELGPEQIGENQMWTITVTVSGERLSDYGDFPNIDGFRKRGTSTQSQTSVVNGQVSSSQGVIMTYMPTRQGTFNVPTFKMRVNNTEFTVQGKKVVVGPPVSVRSFDPFRSLFENEGDTYSRSDPEYVDIKEEAFLALNTNKDEIYVGEGVTTTLSFFVADNNRAPLTFPDNLAKQLGDIMKKLTPANCWEEDFNIENIEGEIVNINGRGYTEYKIYQGTFYPLNSQDINFPSVGLEMKKFKVAKNPTFFGQNRLEGFKTFYTKAKTIKVKELPPHPLQDAVPVGNYRLEERLNSTSLVTGQSVSYDFGIFGEGNISSIDNPIVKKDDNFEFYEPNVRQNINRENGRVTGAKTFRYFMIPKEPGSYQLGDYFQWIYFNTSTHTYDTLRSQQVVNVSGESHKNLSIESSDMGSFYDAINTASNELQSQSNTNWIQWGANIFAVLMVGASVYLISRKTAA